MSESVKIHDFFWISADSKIFKLFLKSQFPNLLTKEIFSSLREISGYFCLIFSWFVVINHAISCSDNFSNTKILDLDNRALLMVKLGFSVVAQMSVMIHFSTYGKSASCWALFRRCISSKNTMVFFLYWRFVCA
jgi:hypothetical protein